MTNSPIKAGISYIENAHQCKYRLSVFVDDVVKVVEYPLTIEFNITRQTSGQSNTATFNIYNLAPSTRRSEHFFQDRLFQQKYKTLKFEAGYNDEYVLLFKGRIIEAYSRRQGTDVITSIQCDDLGVFGDYLSVTFEAGTTKKQAYEYIANNSQGLTMGDLGTLEGEYQTPVTFSGSPLVLLNNITGGHTFIDNSVIKTLGTNEALDYGVAVLNSKSGLLETPQRRGAEVVVTSLFNPNIAVGQMLEIKSDVQTEFNNTYKVFGLNHSGIISGAVAGQRTSTFNLLIMDKLPDTNYNITQQAEKTGAKLVKGMDVYDNEALKHAQNVYSYVRKNNGKIPNWTINNLVSWKDMLGQSNTDDERYRELTPEIIANCEVIANKLYNFISANYGNVKIKINSGWRSKENNARLSNASKESVHLRGSAIDFKFLTKDTSSEFARRFYPRTGWNAFTYMFRTKTSYVIHVQSVNGKGGATRTSKVIV